MSDLSKLSRDELDAEAQRAGVLEPEKLDTKADVVAAIEAVGDTGGVPVQDWWPDGKNPALVHDAPPSEPPESPYVDQFPVPTRRPEPHKYLVTGEQPVRGVHPGGTFYASLDPAQEDVLIWGGHIARQDEG